MNKNSAIIIGRVTKDPQLKTTPSGQSVCSFSMATNQVWNDKNGQKKEKTEFHNIVFWGKTAETISKYVTKGQELLVEGRIETRKWEDQDKRTHYATEIIGESFSFGQKPKGYEAPQQSQTQSGSEFEREVTEPAFTRTTDDQGLPQIDIDEEDIKPEDLPF